MTQTRTTIQFLFNGMITLAVLALLSPTNAWKRSMHPSPSVVGDYVSATSTPAEPTTTTSKQQLSDNYGKLPLVFEANQGQTDAQVKFMSRGSGYNLYLTSTQAVLTLRREKATRRTIENHSAGRRPLNALYGRNRSNNKPAPVEITTVRMSLVGANEKAKVVSAERQLGTVNYFIGNDPGKWQTGVPTYGIVEYQDVYSGVDLVYHGRQRQLEYDFIVKPGADPNQIRLGFGNSNNIRIDEFGDLVLTTKGGEVRQHKPVVWQEVNGARQEISGTYKLNDHDTVGFNLGAYDATRALVIDPVLSYSTYLGGDSSDFGQDIAVDSLGNAYVTGSTGSTNFPTTVGAKQTTYGGGDSDVFVTKLNSAGTALVYSTYLGGNGNDGAFDGETFRLAVGPAGDTYVTASTQSSDFPTTPGAFQTSLNGFSDVFVARLDPTGSVLVYSTYLGGASFEVGRGIAVDAGNNAYVTGNTGSTDFPTTAGAFQTASSGNEAFITKLNASGTALAYSTYLGGTALDWGQSIRVNSLGDAYVAGYTASSDFPTTPGAFQTTYGGGALDCFIAKLNPAGSALVYSSYLGGNHYDGGFDLAVDSSGNAYVSGFTFSPDFPTTAGAFQTTSGVDSNAFVTKINSAGSALVYSTYLGGLSSYDDGMGIAVDSSGNAYVTGRTGCLDFPTTVGAFQTSYGGGSIDTFVAKLNPAGSALVYSTYLGGAEDDAGFGIALDPLGNFYVAGYTNSTNFPTTPGSFQTSSSGASEAFAAKFFEGSTPSPTPTPTPQVGPPTNKNQCKNGGWQQFNTPRTFVNQGDCIQFFNTGK